MSFTKYTGSLPLNETAIDHIPNSEQTAYWASIGQSEGEASDEDFDKLYDAWYAVQMEFWVGGLGDAP